MDFSAETSSLVEALSQIQEAVEKKTTLPILSHVLVEASASGLRLAATDLELGIRTSCPAEVKAPGSVAVPARRLLDIVKSLPDGQVRVRELENNWVQVTSGRSVFRLVAISKDHFPSLPDVPQPLAAVPAGVLAELIERTAFTMSSQESRYTLNAVLLVLNPGKAQTVATDGSRLSLAVRETEVTGIRNEERLLIPKRAVAGLNRLAEAQETDTPVEIAKDESHLFFSAGESLLISRTISGQFPKYESVLPTSNNIVATADAAALRASLARVSLLAPEQSRAVSLAFEPGRLTVSTGGGDAGEATESLDVAYSGEPLRIGFNGHFLLDFLGVVRNGQVEIALKNAESAAELRPIDQEQYRYVIMPMRT
ncbi:MAG: DNA polymerase III subunit beta [Acidobacteriota bacterium]|nr:DNA polymerase III subunit beta [Acidobacteriota bacterium]